MHKCEECGVDHYVGALFCRDCGWFLKGNVSFDQPFIDLTTLDSLNGFRKNTASEFFTPTQEEKTRLVFVIPSSGRKIELELANQIRVGRSDDAREIDPELDLTTDQGVEYGVSREHALVQPGNQGVTLIDLGSTNGTQLNKRRLPPNEPYPISDGDTIRFGRLLVRVFFES